MSVKKEVGQKIDSLEDAIYLKQAIKIARLWREGKMIGGDEDEVRDALLYEVERLHTLIGAYGDATLKGLTGMSQSGL